MNHEFFEGAWRLLSNSVFKIEQYQLSLYILSTWNQNLASVKIQIFKETKKKSFKNSHTLSGYPMFIIIIFLWHSCSCRNTFWSLYYSNLSIMTIKSDLQAFQFCPTRLTSFSILFYTTYQRFIAVNPRLTRFSFWCCSACELFILVSRTYMDFNISLKNDKFVIQTYMDFGPMWFLNWLFGVLLCILDLWDYWIQIPGGVIKEPPRTHFHKNLNFRGFDSKPINYYD